MQPLLMLVHVWFIHKNLILKNHLKIYYEKLKINFIPQKYEDKIFSPRDKVDGLMLV